jgi:uncharacterized protein (TIGR02246 family)
LKIKPDLFNAKVTIMKKLFIPKMLFFLILFPNYSFGQNSFSNTDSFAIKGIAKDFEVAFNAHDAKAFSELFVPNGEFTNVVGASAKGRKAIEEFHAPMFEGKPGYFSFRNSILKNGVPKISVIKPDIASVDIPWTMDKCTLPDGTELKNRIGLITLLMVKEGGKWEIAIMHNAELPPANN